MRCLRRMPFVLPESGPRHSRINTTVLPDHGNGRPCAECFPVFSGAERCEAFWSAAESISLLKCSNGVEQGWDSSPERFVIENICQSGPYAPVGRYFQSQDAPWTTRKVLSLSRAMRYFPRRTASFSRTSSSSPKSIPRAAASLGTRLAGVIPGSVLTSST